MHELKELKEMLCKELKEYGKKKDLTAGTLDVVDKLAHAIKNLDKIIEKEEEYSGDYSSRRYSREGSSRDSSRDNYARDSYAMDSYARDYSGKRDSMGRYARDYSSRDEEMIHKLYEVMDAAPDSATRMEITKLIQKMSEM